MLEGWNHWGSVTDYRQWFWRDTEEKLSSVIGGCYSGAVVTDIQHQSHLVLDVVTSLGIESSWAFTASLNDNYCFRSSGLTGRRTDIWPWISCSFTFCCHMLLCIKMLLSCHMTYVPLNGFTRNHSNHKPEHAVAHLLRMKPVLWPVSICLSSASRHLETWVKCGIKGWTGVKLFSLFYRAGRFHKDLNEHWWKFIPEAVIQEVFWSLVPLRVTLRMTEYIYGALNELFSQSPCFRCKTFADEQGIQCMKGSKGPLEATY